MKTCPLRIDPQVNEPDHEFRERALDNMATVSQPRFAELNSVLPAALIGRLPDRQVSTSLPKKDVVELLFFRDTALKVIPLNNFSERPEQRRLTPCGPLRLQATVLCVAMRPRLVVGTNLNSQL